MSPNARNALTVIVVSLLAAATLFAANEQVDDPLKTETQQEFQKSKDIAQGKTLDKNLIDDYEKLAEQLPEDSTVKFKISSVQITGNTLISTDKLIENMPSIYNSSKNEVASKNLYDLRAIRAVVVSGSEQEISARMIQGFTQYILSEYQKQEYAGIYVYVPSTAYGEGKDLSKGILPITVVEAIVSKVNSGSFDVNNEPVDEGYLNRDVLMEWSPVKEGEVANRKKLDNFVNLLNLNPDRYVSAVVSKGDKDNTLAMKYNIYEANPWHFFGQIDNSGTKDRQWTPRIGMINTNLTGRDDKLTAVYQAPFDKTIDDEYTIFGSYDFPLWSQDLRLNIFGGHNEFDIQGSGDIDFIGRGSFVGGTLKYNLLQNDGWFVDLTGTLSYQKSKIRNSLAEQFPGIGLFDNEIELGLWGYGVNIYKISDMANTSISLNRMANFDGSGQDDFNNARAGGPNARFSIYSASFRHSRYLDPDKIEKVSASAKFVSTNDRLVPAQMTSFGGMYNVRGYDEYEIVADEGFFGSVQYEYDLVKRDMAMRQEGTSPTEEQKKPFLKKLAPLVFFDYGNARNNDATSAEHTDQELASWGVGLQTELGDNFTGVMYYGYPLIETERTREGKGRLNVGFLMRW